MVEARHLATRFPAPPGRTRPARTDAPLPNPVEGPAEWDSKEPLTARSLIAKSRDFTVSDCGRGRQVTEKHLR